MPITLFCLNKIHAILGTEISGVCPLEQHHIFSGANFQIAYILLKTPPLVEN